VSISDSNRNFAKAKITKKWKESEILKNWTLSEIEMILKFISDESEEDSRRLSFAQKKL
jgi:hypothetical protein